MIKLGAMWLLVVFLIVFLSIGLEIGGSNVLYKNHQEWKSKNK